MKDQNLKILFIISALLLLLSGGLSFINYSISLNSVKDDLINRSLPLSVDNIYTEIQTHIIEPNLIASMMSSDTFLKEWLQNNEDNQEQITNYLEAIKNRYGLFLSFLVSEKTKSYYSHEGFLEHIDHNKQDNKWYFEFKNIKEEHEINLDYNSMIDNSLMMFINYKIYDENYHLLGITGVGHKISYIEEMLKRFATEYKFKVMFLNEKGDIVLSQRDISSLTSIFEDPQFSSFHEKILSPDATIFKYHRKNDEYLMIKKYIKDLHLYLLVEAKLSDFTQSANRAFSINLTISFLLTSIITFLIIITVRRYNKKLTFFAQNDPLTQLYNRRYFEEKIEEIYTVSLRTRNNKKFSFIFFDIDNFKKINDTLGHHIGDKVLKRVALIAKMHIRQGDIIARWGGEEFIIALNNTDKEKANAIAEQLRTIIEADPLLQELTQQNVTASFGVTQHQKNETIEQMIARTDTAMYTAKQEGKNRVFTLS